MQGGAAPGSKHPDWCVSDWVLPEEFYPDGTGGLRKRMGTREPLSYRRTLGPLVILAGQPDDELASLCVQR